MISETSLLPKHLSPYLPLQVFPDILLKVDTLIVIRTPSSPYNIDNPLGF